MSLKGNFQCQLVYTLHGVLAKIIRENYQRKCEGGLYPGTREVVSKMGILAQFSNYQNFIKNSNIIPDYAREYKNEYLFIRGIDKTCEKFVKKLDNDGKIFDSPQANNIKFHFNKFLKAQEIEYLKDISEFYLKENDISFVESLGLQLDDYTDRYHDPDSYEFDQEKQDNNVENDYPGFKYFFESLKIFQDKLKVDYSFESYIEKLENLDTESESESYIDESYIDDSDSDEEIDVDEIFDDSDSDSD